MSEKTKEALDEAVKNHFADEVDGALMTDYLITAAGVSSTDQNVTEYLYGGSDSPYHTLYGLAYMAIDKIIEDEDDS